MGASQLQHLRGVELGLGAMAAQLGGEGGLLVGGLEEGQIAVAQLVPTLLQQ
jgi:hypothetical protein